MPPACLEGEPVVSRALSAQSNVWMSPNVPQMLPQFRALRKALAPKAARPGVYTDQDVFDRVS